MEPTFPFESMMLFGFVSTMPLAGVFLRAKIRIFQNYLIPSCLLGGGLGLVLTYTAAKTGLVKIDLSALEPFAYHFFNISLHRHFYRFCKPLENGLDLVMFIFAFSLDIQVAFCAIREGLENVEEHLCRKVSDHLSFEFSFPDQPIPTTEIDGYLRCRHRIA